MYRGIRGWLAAGIFSFCGCAQDLDEPGLVGVGTNGDEGAVIVDSINWQESVLLPAGSPEAENASATALVEIPARSTRCTGFLIANNVLMTNEHCIPTEAAARGVVAYFRWEQGIPRDQGVACGTLIGNDKDLDFALLECSGSPGSTFGVAELDASTVRESDGVYLIHQNCDYYSSPGCDPTKKYSPGKVLLTIKGQILHDADTLGGSSGGPLFSRTHQVIGLHNLSSSNNDGRGRGPFNLAVSMRVIKPILQQRFPGIALNSGPRLAIGVSWVQSTEGRYSFRAAAPDEVQSVEYFIDGYPLGAAARADGAAFEISYSFTTQSYERKLHVVGRDANGDAVARGVALLDTVSAAGGYIRQTGEREYEIGVERVSSAVAAIEVIADGSWLLPDSATGLVRSPRLAVRYRFSGVGERSFVIRTYNADGSIRGNFNRTFTLR